MIWKLKVNITKKNFQKYYVKYKLGNVTTDPVKTYRAQKLIKKFLILKMTLIAKVKTLLILNMETSLISRMKTSPLEELCQVW